MDINGAWSSNDDAWVSEAIHLTGDCILDVELQGEGRLVIKKSESEDGPYPKVLISDWGGPKFRIKLFGVTDGKYVKVYTTSVPDLVRITNY